MRYLFVVAHPDDEILGAGATIHESIKAGHEIGVLVLCSEDKTRYEDDRSRIVTDLERSHRRIGIKNLTRAFFHDGNFHLDDHRKMVEIIEAAIRQFKPDSIFTQHPGDINSDHYWTAQSCMEAFRLWQRCREDVKPIESLYLMEVPSSTDWGLNPALSRFNANVFVPVSEEALRVKIDALKVYENVVRPVPHPRSEENIMAIARMRGAQSGAPYAEAFECVFRRVV